MNEAVNLVRTAFLITAFSLTSPQLRALEEIGNLGVTIDIVPYLSRLHNSRSRTQAITPILSKSNRFPIKSDGIQAGEVTSKAIDLPELHSPVCVVGADTLSSSWIGRHRDTLQRLRAICLITNVSDQEEANRVRAMLSPVPAFAAPVHALLGRVQVDRYPVLISRYRVEQ